MVRKMLAALLCASGMALATGSAGAADAQLTFRYAYDNVDEIQAGLTEFEKRNSGIKVKMERIAFKDARDQLIRETATGGGPDVAHLAYVWIKDLGTAEACMKLNDLIAKHGIGENGYEGFIANDLPLGTDGKTIYGVPFATDTWAMVYNTDVMKAAGIAKIPETWDELLAASRTVKAKTGKIGFGFAAGTSAANTIWFLANFNWWSDGGTLVEDDGKGGYKVGIEPAQVASVFKYFDTFIKEDLTTKGSLGIDAWNAPEVMEPIIRGDQFAAIVPVFTAVQMFDSWRARNPGKELPFTTAMTPHGKGKPTTHLGGQSLCVNPSTKNVEASWKLMQWLNSWEFFEKYNTGYYPSQKALLAKRPFPEEMKGFQKQFTEGARSWGPYARGPAVIGAMWNQTSRSFGQAAVGEKTYDQAATDLLAFVQGQLKK